MTDAKMCDRCGEFYKSLPPGYTQREYKITRDKNNSGLAADEAFIEVDLCNSCYESFEEWYDD